MERSSSLKRIVGASLIASWLLVSGLASPAVGAVAVMRGEFAQGRFGGPYQGNPDEPGPSQPNTLSPDRDSVVDLGARLESRSIPSNLGSNLHLMLGKLILWLRGLPTEEFVR